MAQTDRDRLLRWMQERDMDIEALGAATGDTYSALFLMLRAEGRTARPIGVKFIWRFAHAFGLDEAAKVFADMPPLSVGDDGVPVSVHTTTVAN